MGSKVDDNFKNSLSWEEKAQRNPLFAVMSADQFAEKSSNPDEWTQEDLKKFFDKGQYFYEIFFRPLLRRIPVEPHNSFIVEYGCGMGRILKAVSADGYGCAGIDISPTMLELSQRLVPEVKQLYALTETGTTALPKQCADFVFSYAVLQHINRLSLVKRALNEMCRVLKPGGTIKFQFRTIDVPYRRSPAKRRSILNFETFSLVIKRKKYFKHLPFISNTYLPTVDRVQHTNWVGVPLSIRMLEEELYRHRVRILGIEEDPGHENMFWLSGRKEG